MTHSRQPATPLTFPHKRGRRAQSAQILGRPLRASAGRAQEEREVSPVARVHAKQREFVLSLSCCDSKGVVYAVSGVLFQAGCSIIDSQQFGDVGGQDDARLFFMRVHFDAPRGIADISALEKLFAHIAGKFGMTLRFHDLDEKLRVIIMASKQGHCLNDLLFRQMANQLPIDIVGIVSNHADLGEMAHRYELPFYHFPLGPHMSTRAKRAQERHIQALVERERVNLLVLARYMQILTPEFCHFLKGWAINIHHSFLPSFKGAYPYQQAHSRGVKLIGATAHYVTADLDEGPIIEQDIERVDHSVDPNELAAIGRDVECVVLARAVKWHSEHRVLLNGHKTIVFR